MVPDLSVSHSQGKRDESAKSEIKSRGWSLFSDMLGSHLRHYPRRSKRYADIARFDGELQEERVAAFRAFFEDVEQVGYPQRRHGIWMNEAEFEVFAKATQRI